MINPERNFDEGPYPGSRSVPVWFVISRYENNRLRVLHVPSMGEETLLIFSTEPSASGFLERHGLAPEWHVRETTAGELTSILLSPPAQMLQVSLDPPASLDDSGWQCTSRKDFIAALMGEPLLVPSR